MTTLSHIAVHHTGGIGADNYASSRHLTFDAINNAHKNRADWIGYHAHKSQMGNYGGYTAAYDPKTRQFKQFRLLGEETLAQVGYNLTAFSLCIIGNYMERPYGSPRGSVDPLTIQIENDVADFLIDLVDGNKRGLAVAPNTKLDFTYLRIRPHRFYQPSTQCYGTFLDDNWARRAVLVRKISYLKRLYYELFGIPLGDYLDRLEVEREKLGADDKSCEGHI